MPDIRMRNMFSSVLVLGAEPRIAVSIARSLKRHGIPVDVAALSQNDVRLSSKAIRKFSCLPDHKNEAQDFIGFLERLILLNHYSMLIPCSDTALTEVVRYYDRLESMVNICSPKPEIIKRVLDKNETLKLAQSCGIPVPVTYHISDISELRDLRQTLRYPMIAKPLSKRKSSHFKIRYFYGFEEIEKAFSVDPQFGTNTLFQEYCSGEGIGIGTFIHNKEPIAVYQHRRLKEYPSTGGVSVLAISEEPDPLLVRYSTRLLNAIGWEGIALVEFRFNRKERSATLMEINGRYWGSIASAIHAGIDFPFYEWQHVHKQHLNVPSRYRGGLRVRWVAGDLRRLHELLTRPRSNSVKTHSRGAEIIQFFTDFSPSVRHMLWSYSDPLPAVIEIFCVFKSLLFQDAKALINKIIPLKTHTHLKTLRNLDKTEKVLYFLHIIRRSIWMPQIKISKNKKKAFNILFLCHGNIIRSPMAEALFKQKASKLGLKNVRAMSAGIYAKQGIGADPRSVTVAQEFDICLKGYRAKPITMEIIEEADAIFVMDSLNEAGLLGRYPTAWKKLYMLGSFSESGPLKKGEIEDPYNGDIDDIRRCYKILHSTVLNLVVNITESCKRNVI